MSWSTNSLKHAFKGLEKGYIKIFVDLSNNLYTIIVEDNGAGFPLDFDIAKTSTFGLKLVKTLVNQLKGNIVITRDGITRIEITFPGITNKERLDLRD